MSRPVVLVAEDDASVRLTLEFVLKDGGFEVLFAHDGEEALRLALSSLPSAILLDQVMPKMDGKEVLSALRDLLDQVMPKMDGKEVLSALRDDDTTAEIPVFVLTGMDRGSADDWPGAHFVGKPFSPGDLVAKLKSAIAVPD